MNISIRFHSETVPDYVRGETEAEDKDLTLYFDGETMLTKDEKLAQLKLTLDEKIKRTKELILEWYLQYNGQVYVAYSG